MMNTESDESSLTLPTTIGNSTVTRGYALVMCNGTTCNSSGEFNSTATNPLGDGRDESLAMAEIIIQAVILFLAAFGNGIVLLILLRRRSKLSRMNLMIVHLSAADLFVALFNILPQLIWDVTFRFYGNDFLCRWVKWWQVLAMYASSYVLVSTAIDRYLAICHPLTAHVWSSRNTHLLVGAAWVLSALFSGPQLWFFAYREVTGRTGVYDCWALFEPEWTAPVYVTFVTLAIYIIPFLILALAYGRICYVVRKSMLAREPSIVKTASLVKTHSKYRFSLRSNKSKQTIHNGSYRSASTKSLTGDTRNGSAPPRAHVRTMSRAKVKTVKLTLTVIVCYLLCWGPFFICQMWSVWDPHAPFSGTAMTLMLLLAGLNSCTNPWIYLAFSDNLHHQVSRCFRSERKSPQSSLRTRSMSRSVTGVTRLDSVRNSPDVDSAF